ncbi:MAG TPA: helix-turn-helix transcriptional regulator [Candidatus Sulfotelmatobacter sp.]|nr:helix-turn-helix transcriptional regulator [Candidatus Sulfotelmatobacter sp.]
MSERHVEATTEQSGLSSDLNATAASLLGLLLRGPQTGWELYAAFEESIGHFWSLTRSQVYRELKTMADRGLIELGASGPRESRRCTITQAGRAAFHAWIARMPGDEIIRFPLLLTIFFGEAVPPQALVDACTEHRRIHAERLAVYEVLLPKAREHTTYSALALAFGLDYERMVLRWIDGLPWMRAEDSEVT